MKNKQDKIRKELTLAVQTVAQFYKKYVKHFKDVTIEMSSFSKDQQCFLLDLLSLPSPFQKATQIQLHEGDTRLVLKLAIAKYPMTEPKPIRSVLSWRYSIRPATL